MRRIALRLAASALLLVGAGCSRPTPPALPPGPAQWKITFSVTPALPRSLDPAKFQVQVADKSGRPISGAAVSAALVMPSMDMGQNTVTLSETRTPGIYVGAGRFTMAGDWQATVQAGKGAVHQPQSFPISVR